MSDSEFSKLKIVELVKSKQITQIEGARRLGLSKRQMIRLCKAYEQYGPKGLVSKRRGNPSNNRLSDEVKIKAIMLVTDQDSDFGPTFAHQKLTEEHGLKLSVESLRQLMIQEGVWKGRKRKAARYHPIRTRRASYGELVQIDGSYHHWFEGREEKCCLIVFIDDATSQLMELRFVKCETTEAYFDATKSYLMRHGRPLSFYSDKHSIFKVNIKEAESGTGETQFSRGMRELGIELICANSPQAKGRVEKANRTLQDRLVKELRLKGISDIDTANEYLPEFRADYNKRFAVKAASPDDAHRSTIPEPEVLNLLLSHQETRKLSKNLEMSYQNVLYQVQVKGEGYSMRGAQIKVCDQGGEVTLLHKGRILQYKTKEKQQKATPVKTAKELEIGTSSKSRKPAKNHPWRGSYQLRSRKKVS